jgi:DNA-binding PadR family transcriptional regulator
MYRDNSLMPKEAGRLAVLGTLLAEGPRRYAELAASLRHFTSRIAAPSLDMMGTSLEVLRCEGLIEALDGPEDEGDALLAATDSGTAEFRTLMHASMRPPCSDDVNRLIVTLKLRFLHLLPEEDRRPQAEAMAALYDSELARLEDLHRAHAGGGLLDEWLDHEAGQARATRDWLLALAHRLDSGRRPEGPAAA